jgi:uncharacterized protein YxjI
MEITIQQRLWAIGAKFDIATPEGNYTASKNFLSVLTGFQVFDPQDRTIAQLKSSFTFFRPQFTITLANGSLFLLTNQSFLKGTYTCEGNNEKYVIYAHRGRSFSVFKNEQQIAAFAHQTMTMFNGNVIDVRADDNVDIGLLVSIVLCIEAPQDQKSGQQVVSFDFGKIGPEERPIDPNWQPARSR